MLVTNDKSTNISTSIVRCHATLKLTVEAAVT